MHAIHFPGQAIEIKTIFEDDQAEFPRDIYMRKAEWTLHIKNDRNTTMSNEGSKRIKKRKGQSEIRDGDNDVDTGPLLISKRERCIFDPDGKNASRANDVPFTSTQGN